MLEAIASTAGTAASFLMVLELPCVEAVRHLPVRHRKSPCLHVEGAVSKSKDWDLTATNAGLAARVGRRLARPPDGSKARRCRPEGWGARGVFYLPHPSRK